jgi:hypothetical protein
MRRCNLWWLLLCLPALACSKEEETPAASSGVVTTKLPAAPKNETSVAAAPAGATRENAPPAVQRFVGWVDEVAPILKTDPRQFAKPSEVECFTDKSDPARGLCMADVQVHTADASTYSVNWAQKAPEAFKVAAILPGVRTPVSCEHLGGTRLSRTERESPPPGYEERCKLSDERQAVIERIGAVTRLLVFSVAYLQYDPELEQ